MRVLVVAGARPNFMKVAPILAELRRLEHEAVLVHTGQHYDTLMSDSFFRDLAIPNPDYHLEVGSGSHAQQTARVMQKFEPVLLDIKPNWVVVVGDVNSTLACALVTAKLHEQTGAQLAHVEAGLRSGDWRMPEEVNRVLTDRLSNLLLTPSRDALPNLIAEGIPQSRVVFVGNVMIDTLHNSLPAAQMLSVPAKLCLNQRNYAVATLHRPSNVDSADALRTILTGLATVASDMPVILPIHPRTRLNAERFGLGEMLNRLRVLEPLGYLEMLSLVQGATVVLTDSGGLQEETTALGVPCVTLREQTERPVTITDGTNRLAGWPLTVDNIRQATEDALATSGSHRPSLPDGWDGHASQRVVQALDERALA